MPRPASKTGIALRVGFGLSVFAWMAWSGKLDLAQVVQSLAHWPSMLAIVALAYLQVAVTTGRWRLLLAAQGIELPFSLAWGLMMIGMLFNIVIPGAVGGDLVKGYYIARAAPGRKSHAVTSVLMDRVVGLIGLLSLGAVMAAVNLGETMKTPATRSLGLLTAGAFAGGLGGLYVALMVGRRISQWSLLPAPVRNVFDALHEYRRRSPAVAVALALSVVNQGITCAMYYLALRSAGVAGLPAGQFFLIVPLGLVTTALPISPGGIGVGQAAFFSLFKIVAPAYAAAGTNAITVLQVLVILVSLSGTYWYVSYKHTVLDGHLPEEDTAAAH